MQQSKTPVRRCAIYTRKSSEEGLEQDFNSLHAQREACEAFIKSQAGEGWRLVKAAYDDGGLSGGTMERPALQRLLADIGEGLVDVVVVYKVDRLTRSLTDFAKMVEVFDARGVSFVAVTQQFNTTTSMVQRSVGGPGAVDRRDRQARTSYGPSRAARDAAGVSGAQDRRGDCRRPPACGPQHHRDDPENRTAPALERAAASSGTPIDSRGRSCLRQAFFPRTRVRRWTCQNREQRILIDFCRQPQPLAFSGSTTARESRPTRRFYRFSKK